MTDVCDFTVFFERQKAARIAHDEALTAIARAFGRIGIDCHPIWAERFVEALRAEGFEAAKFRRPPEASIPWRAARGS
jgi:hypothetical protein